MPIYEYRCQQCHKRYSLFLRGFSQVPEPVCPFCRSASARRLISRFSVVKGEESRLEDMTDSSVLDGLDESDPRSLARFARRMSTELGEEMPAEFDEMVDRLEAGESPESVERALGLGAEGSEGNGPDDGGLGGMSESLS